MIFRSYQALALDLFARVERAVASICEIAVDTGITFQIADVVDVVERGLPPDYPVPAADGPSGRRAMIERMARDIFSGDVHE